MRIISRKIDVERIKKGGPWVLVYGRRKTGKTFLVSNFLSFDRFFFVNRDSTVRDVRSMELYSFEEFLKVFREILGRESVVIDEFHRLPGSFLDFLHSVGVKGRLVLITSTLWLAKRMLGRGSPLLGLVTPVRIGLIDEREIVVELSKELSGRELVEASTYLREVTLIPLYDGSVRELLVNYLAENSMVIRGMVGEIFTEEDKELTNVYEGIMKAVADGRNVSGEISTLLFSRGVLAKDNPGVLQRYLSILVEIGVLERVKVYGKKRFKYFHRSPLLDLHYYLEENYSYTEVYTPREFIRKVIDEKVPIHVQWFLKDLLVKALGLQHNIIEERGLEVDIALLRFKRLEVIAEVKWRRFVPRSEVRKVEDKLSRFKCRKILFVPDESVLEREPEEDIEVWGVNEMLSLARESLGNANAYLSM